MVSEAAGGGGFRGRVDTVWDDVRVQKEWTQVRIVNIQYQYTVLLLRIRHENNNLA